MSRVVAFLVFLFSASIAFPQSGEPNVAVNDPVGQGVDTAEAAVVPDSLRSEVISPGVSQSAQPLNDSVAAAQKRSKKARQWARRIVFGGLGLVCGGVGLVYNAAAAGTVDNQKQVLADYHAARTDFQTFRDDYASLQNDVDSYTTVRNIFYLAGGVFGAAMVISIPF
jgi:hypothetical protein